MIPKSEAVERLKRQIARIADVGQQPQFSSEFKKWHRDTEVVIEKIFGGETRHLKDFRDISYTLGAFSSSTPDSEFQKRFLKGLEDARLILTSMVEELEQYSDEPPLTTPPRSASTQLERLFDRFHLVVRQIRSRHDNRPTLDVEDEYDVQDLLRCLLFLEFEDVRVEEWTPSYAGGSSRMDFILKREATVVEVKKTRPKLGAREVGDQLLIDIGRYHSHPDCSSLVCFVYDPEGRIANPRGLEADLTKQTNGIDVHVFIRPTGL